jgi:hypothetical protein
MTREDDDRRIAHLVAEAFGGVWTVTGYTDPAGTARIDVLTTAGPERGLTSFGAIGLSDRAIPGRPRPPLGCEIVAVSNLEEFGAVLATSAFCVLNSGWRVEPGVVFPAVVAEHVEDVTTPHLMFVTPYLWDGLESRALSGRTVAWLMGVPITDAERRYAGEHGAEALEDRFERDDPDLIDLWRPSVV